MRKSKPYTVYPVNENTLTIRVGDAIDGTTHHTVFRVYHQLVRNRHASWLDIIPAYTTISIVYDVVKIRENHPSAVEWMIRETEKILAKPFTDENFSARKITIPVCYDDAFALDRKALSVSHKIGWDEVVSIHSSRVYQVFMIGFLPGFAYMGMVDQRIAFPRLANPRAAVPAGSVGIAGEQTGIYPLDSPGGWNIIGRTPLLVFDIKNQNPGLLQPHDKVTFLPIAKSEFDSFDITRFNPVSV